MYKKHSFNLTVICMAAILSFLTLLFFIYPEKTILFSNEVEKTEEILIGDNHKDIDEIKLAITAAKNNISFNNSSDAKSALKFRFVNTVVLGDSVAEGLLDYRVLDESVCIGRRGARINTIDDDFNSIKVKKPSVIFLEYGLNDIGYWNGNAKRFIEVYEEKVKIIEKELPDAKIYINAILPIDQSAIDNNPLYANYPEFNKELKKLCEKTKCTYIDNSFILDQLEVKYEFDGVHPKYEYYYLWASNMAKVAGL